MLTRLRGRPGQHNALTVSNEQSISSISSLTALKTSHITILLCINTFKFGTRQTQTIVEDLFSRWSQTACQQPAND
ncbi:hypothetical protein [Spirosoma gilvum]